MLDFNITKIIGKDYFKFILVSGEVNSANNASSINWNVIEDENIAYYTVLRSTDSLNFVSIGNKTALANNLPTNNYQMPDSLKDITAPVAKIYYQIVSVYKDSSRVRSNTISMGGILGPLKLHFEEFSLSNKDNIVNIKWKD